MRGEQLRLFIGLHLLEQGDLPVQADGGVEHIAGPIHEGGDGGVRIRQEEEVQFVEFGQSAFGAEVVQVLDEVNVFTGLPSLQDVRSPSNRHAVDTSTCSRSAGENSLHVCSGRGSQKLV